MRVAETSGRTVDEAIGKALAQLGLRRDQVDVDVITEGKAGILGFGSADAIVRVTARDSVVTTGGQRGGRGGRGRGEAPRRPSDRSEGVMRGEPREEPRGEGRAEAGGDDEQGGPRRDDDDGGAREGRRRRGRRGGRGRGGARAGEGQRQEAPTGAEGERREAGRSDERSGPREGGRGGRREGERERGRGGERRERSSGPVNAVSDDELVLVPGAPDDLPAAPNMEAADDVDLAGSTLRDVLTLLGYTGTEITARDPETPGDGTGLIEQVFDIYGEDDDTSDELGVLIGRRGETLASLQYLINTIVAKGGTKPPVFGIDIEGYRRRREQMLVDLAREIAQEVRETGDVITLEPMPAYERRIVHLALEGEEGVRTESVGSGEDRQVEVLPD